MKSTIIHLAVIGGLLAAGGCTKQEIVKKEEPLAPTAAQAKPVKVEKPAPEKVPAAQQPITQAKPVAASQQKQAASTPDNGQLKEALEKVYFSFDSSNLDVGARQSLTKNAAFMKKNGSAKVRIEGNCDERGSDEYNLALGERRAKAAMQYLVTMGVPAARLSVISYGKEKPADPGHDEAAWARNRRDEFVIR